MANVLFWQGKSDEALKELESVPLNAMSGRTMVLMADLYRSRKKNDRAEPLYRRYLEKNEDDLGVRLKLAETLSWGKKYDASLVEYEKILHARPNDTQLRRKYAFVLMWTGRHSEAAKELRRTLK
jgi:Flp pilus assembly protein TadD